MRGGLFGLFGGTVLLAASFVFFSLGASAGASAAMNESISLSDYSENISTIDESVIADVKANSSGYVEDFNVFVASTVSNSAITSANAGLWFGYEFPGAARVLVPLAPVGMIAIALSPLYKVAKGGLFS